VRLTLIRNATLRLEIAGRRLLVDPMLDDVGARPPVEDTPNPRRNPLVPLPVPAEEVVRDLDAVLVTHLHRDHLDDTAASLLPRNVPVGGDPLVMTTADIREVVARVPTVVIVHLEAINHCLETREEVRAAVPAALVPEDGETLLL
jgi:L-ascorbate metabolism protein UlaG (beta-lactamase superfamily)